MPDMLEGPIDQLPAAFDGYEVAIVAEITDAKGDSFCERVDDPGTYVSLSEEGGALWMFSVYGHFPSGGVHAFADRVVIAEEGATAYENARQYAVRLANTIDAGQTAHGVLDLTFDEPTA